MGQLYCNSSVLYLLSSNSLALNLSGLRVFQLLGFVDVQEEVLQQLLSLAQFVWDLILMLEGQLFLVIFKILAEVDNRWGEFLFRVEGESERGIISTSVCVCHFKWLRVSSPQPAALPPGGCLSPPGRHSFASGRSTRPSRWLGSYKDDGEGVRKGHRLNHKHWSDVV